MTQHPSTPTAQDATPPDENDVKWRPATKEETNAAYQRLHKEQVERSPFKPMHRTQEGK